MKDGLGREPNPRRGHVNTGRAAVGLGAMMDTAPRRTAGAVRRANRAMIVSLRKSWLWAAVVTLAIGAAMPAFADYETGLRAYELGDYEGAIEEILPLARRGDPGSQFLLGRRPRRALG